jgi:hypothetical protein
MTEAFNTREMREAGAAYLASQGLSAPASWGSGFQREIDQSLRGLALMNSKRTAPVFPKPAATEAQLSFLAALQDQRVVTDVLALAIAWEMEQPSGPTRTGVSALIDALKASAEKPRATSVKLQLPEVPEGHYALDRDGVVKFYKIDRPNKGKWAGFTFVNVQASDDYFPVRGEAAKAVLAEIVAVGPKVAAIRYGHEIGRCSLCNRTLTDETSRAAGLGPVCAEKVGW